MIECKINEWTDINAQMNERMTNQMQGLTTHRWISEQIIGWMEKRMDGFMKEWFNKWVTDEWMNELTNAQMDEYQSFSCIDESWLQRIMTGRWIDG